MRSPRKRRRGVMGMRKQELEARRNREGIKMRARRDKRVFLLKKQRSLLRSREARYRRLASKGLVWWPQLAVFLGWEGPPRRLAPLSHRHQGIPPHQRSASC